MPDRGYWGEVLTTGALARGLAGLVIDGGVRDVGALEALGFPVFSRTIALPGATKLARGSVGSDHARWPGCRSARGTGWSATSTAWWWCPAEALDETRGRRSSGEPRPRPATSPPSAQGSTTVELLGLDASLIEVGPND